MRNIERISAILDLLREEWYANPDQRLGQLIINVARSHDWPEENLFNLEDYDLERFLLDNINIRNK